MFLTKRPNGIYNIVYFTSNGKRTTKSTNTTNKAIAKKYLTLFEEEFLDRQISKVTPITLEEYCWKFLKYSETMHTWKTTKAFKTTFNLFIKYFGKNTKLSEFNLQKIEEYLQMRIRTASIYCARKDHINLSSAFSKALKEGYVLKNPLKEIKRFRLPERLPLYFSEAEFSTLVNAIDKDDLKDIVIFTVNTGLRQAELTSLRWEYIIISERLFILNNRNHVTKSKRIRTIPLNEKAYNILLKRMENRQSEFVFTFSNKPIKPDWLSKIFKHYVRKSQVNQKLTFHSLRHSFASWLVQKGTSIYLVSKLLGHSDIKTTQIYSHVTTENLQQVVDIL